MAVTTEPPAQSISEDVPAIVVEVSRFQLTLNEFRWIISIDSFHDVLRVTVCVLLTASVAGFKGERCEQDVDECLYQKCLNGGTCKNLRGSFECRCLPEFFGPMCESTFSASLRPVGLCRYLHRKPVTRTEQPHDSIFPIYSFVFPTGISAGSYNNTCSEQNPCENGGSCVPFEANDPKFLCSCPEGFTGQRCEDVSP